MVRPPKSVEVGLDLKVFSIKGTWEPNEDERKAAWELYVELITRVATVPLEHGLLREALNSLYSLFASSPARARSSVVTARASPNRNRTASTTSASSPSPCSTSRCDPLWRSGTRNWRCRRHQCPADASRAEHEQAWPEKQALRDELNYLRAVLSRYAGVLATACGVPNLLDAVPKAQ